MLDRQLQPRVYDDGGEANHPRIIAYKSKNREKTEMGARPKERRKTRKKGGNVERPVPDKNVPVGGDTEWCPKQPVKAGIPSDRKLRSHKQRVTFSDIPPSSPPPPPIPNSDDHSSHTPFPSHPPTEDQTQTLNSSDNVNDVSNPAVVDKDSLSKLRSDLGSLTLKKGLKK